MHRFASFAWLLAFASMFTGSVANADDSKEYARLARSSWAAFACSTFANLAELGTDEQIRLFEYGIDAGRKFIVALENHLIKEEDMRAEVPIGFTFELRGPSVDFVLGRVYSRSSDYAYEEVTKNLGLKDRPATNWEIRQKLQAGDHYTSSNCSLLGR